MALRAALYGLVLACLAGCGPPPPDEEQIRQRIDDMTTALAEGNVRALMAPLADDFGTETWNMDPRAVRLLIQRELRASNRLRARVFDIDVVVHDNQRATVEFQAVLTGGSGLIPDRRGWYRFRTGWRKEDDEWLLISAAWEEVVQR
ncbi:MAG: hypothetical protein ACXIUB_03120 [Wenzhouxiangella sp.]